MKWIKFKKNQTTQHFVDGTKEIYEETKGIVKEINQTIDLRHRLREIVFNSKTPLGKLFDIVLMLVIFSSVMVIILHSVASLREKYGTIFMAIDWFFTLIFTIEYGIRIYAAKDRKAYIFSFWGVIDFLSVIPSAFSLWITGQQTIQVIRIIRFLRIFKVLRLVRFIAEGYELLRIIQRAFYKIAVFMSFIFVLVILLGAVMYVVEEQTPGFESIPSSIYFAVLTITTVGYGDITPVTPIGRFIASIIMLAGYALLAVPTIIIGTETAKTFKNEATKVCTNCHTINKSTNKFCSECGQSFRREQQENEEMKI